MHKTVLRRSPLADLTEMHKSRINKTESSITYMYSHVGLRGGKDGSEAQAPTYYPFQTPNFRDLI